MHVTSGAHIFPLPPAIPDPSSAGVLSNGTSVDPLSVSWGNPASTPAGFGSDESLGGALLTPIPWLSSENNQIGTHSPLEGEVTTESTEMIDGPNGLGGVETVSVSVNGISSARQHDVSSLRSSSGGSAGLREGGVTQGEHLRQERRAGMVPDAQLEDSGDADGMGEEDEVPHARGPDEIGMEDMGPQGAGGRSERGGSGRGMRGIDIEAAVGRRIEAGEAEGKEEEVTDTVAPKREAEEEIGGEEKRLKEDVEDLELADADQDEKKVEKGEDNGADAVDTATV